MRFGVWEEFDGEGEEDGEGSDAEHSGLEGGDFGVCSEEG